jgi:hypothetical protein
MSDHQILKENVDQRNLRSAYPKYNYTYINFLYIPVVNLLLPWA